MSDYSELKRLAERIREGSGLQGMNAEEAMFNFECAATPAAVLALIAENETIKDLFDECARLFVDATEQACKAQRERDQLKDENDRLRQGVAGDFDLDARIEWAKEAAKRRAENEALRKRIDDMSPFKGAPLTGPDLKCSACGGYHYGMSGLPCPKMAPMAQGAKDD